MGPALGKGPSSTAANAYLCRRCGTITQRFDKVDIGALEALERKHPGFPLAPGKVEQREFEYVPHGTRSFILSCDVVSGQLLAPACGPTHTEADFLAHLLAVVSTQPEATRWHTVCDQLNTHQSESLVRLSSLTCQALKRI